MIAISRNYSRHTDHNTGARFEPQVDPATGCHVGVAEITEEQAEALSDRSDVELYTLQDWAKYLSDAREEKQRLAEEALAAVQTSGNPITDAAAATGKPRSGGRGRKKAEEQVQEPEADAPDTEQADASQLPPPPPPPASE